MTFVAIDTETTGLSARDCELVEIAAVRFAFDGEVISRFDTLVDPGCPIPRAATAVHGITDAMVRGKPTIRDAVPSLFDFIASCPSIVLIHNASFDLSFLRAAARRVGVLCPDCPVICTLGLARRRLRDMPRHRLDMLVSRFLGRSAADHRAGGDADALRHIFLQMLICEPVIASVDELLATAKVRPFRAELRTTACRLSLENSQI